MDKKPNTTETLPPFNKLIDRMTQSDALLLMLDSHAEVIPIIREVLPEIESAVNLIYNRLIKSNTSRLIYVGAGTSARIGVQDGAELYPTFGWPLNRIDFIIAGNKNALIKPIEDAEDDIKDASRQFKKTRIKEDDVIIALSASGKTPFTLELIKQSKKKGALTIVIVNNDDTGLENYCDKVLMLNTGYEIVAGSTRLKAGTAQKICLNLISTLLMTTMGKVQNGKMINLVATNQKLRERKLKIGYC